MFLFIQMSWIYLWPGCLPWGVGAAEQLQTQECNCCVFPGKARALGNPLTVPVLGNEKYHNPRSRGA